MKKVEQITKEGLVVMDQDSVFTKSEMQSIVSRYFPLKNKSSFYSFYKDNKEYFIQIKNITYLGIPHATFKKRIQVYKSDSWAKVLESSRDRVFLLGIYHYKDNMVFALFDNKLRGKNSSAHISTIDILKATESGVFTKTDNQKNKLIVFTPEKFYSVFDSLFKKETVRNSEEIELFDHFTETLEKEWSGIDSYKEMIAAKFRDKFQPEWPGFYHEFRFEKFLQENNQYKEICEYVKDKSKGSLDFDVRFPKSNFLGDLKAHGVNSNGIPGNDKRTVESAVKKHQKLWYMTIELKQRKDSDFKCVVSNFWNSEINRENINRPKKDLNSYCKKMKCDVSLLEFYILEINEFNMKYISDFHQGKNSNGKEREVKILIKSKDIDNFVIYRKSLI